MGQSLQLGSVVSAQSNIDFGDVEIGQGTKGKVVTQNNEYVLVRWDGIGDRPASPSQLLVVDTQLVADEHEDEEEFFMPTSMVGRKATTQATIKEEKDAV